MGEIGRGWTQGKMEARLPEVWTTGTDCSSYPTFVQQQYFYHQNTNFSLS